MLSCVWLSVTLQTVAHQSPLSMEFSRHKYWSGTHSFLQGMFPMQGLNLGFLHYRLILYHLSHQGNPLSLGWTYWIASNKWNIVKVMLTKRFRLPSWVALSHWFAWAILAATLRTSLWRGPRGKQRMFPTTSSSWAVNCHACEILSRFSLVKFGDGTQLDETVHTWWQPCGRPSVRGTLLSCAWISWLIEMGDNRCLLL